MNIFCFIACNCSPFKIAVDGKGDNYVGEYIDKFFRVSRSRLSLTINFHKNRSRDFAYFKTLSWNPFSENQLFLILKKPGTGLKNYLFRTFYHSIGNALCMAFLAEFRTLFLMRQRKLGDDNAAMVVFSDSCMDDIGGMLPFNGSRRRFCPAGHAASGCL
jgi:hypothetical protein